MANLKWRYGFFEFDSFGVPPISIYYLLFHGHNKRAYPSHNGAHSRLLTTPSK
jgi:hypothetical protein